jgi:hypothetical protein
MSKFTEAVRQKQESELQERERREAERKKEMERFEKVYPMVERVLNEASVAIWGQTGLFFKKPKYQTKRVVNQPYCMVGSYSEDKISVFIEDKGTYVETDFLNVYLETDVSNRRYVKQERGFMTKSDCFKVHCSYEGDLYTLYTDSLAENGLSDAILKIINLR